MNIIFVDIDGPLLPQKMHLNKLNHLSGIENPPIFDNFAVTAFNLWAKYGNAKIVFSTAWAYNFDDDQLKDIMKFNGLEFEYVDDKIVCTPKRRTSRRHDEILDWLNGNSTDDMKWIAVDDDTDCEWIEKIIDDKDRPRTENFKGSGKWIKVDFVNGLTYQNFKDGCEVLGIEQATIKEQEFGIKQKTPEEIEEYEKALKLLIQHMV